MDAMITIYRNRKVYCGVRFGVLDSTIFVLYDVHFYYTYIFDTRIAFFKISFIEY